MSRRVQTNFTGGASSDAKKVRAKAEEPVPQGTVKEILEWVGEDMNRAERAWNVENESADPRVTILEATEKIIDDAAE